MAEAYGEDVVSERHRHRYEFNPGSASRFEGTGLVCSGTSPDGRLVEFIELDGHPFWVGTQAHPEFKSRPDRAGPAVPGARRRRPGNRAEGRNPHLFDARDLEAADGREGDDGAVDFDLTAGAAPPDPDRGLRRRRLLATWRRGGGPPPAADAW